MLTFICSNCGCELETTESTVNSHQDVTVEFKCPDCSTAFEEVQEDNDRISSENGDILEENKDLSDELETVIAENEALESRVDELETFIDEYINTE